MSKLFIGLMKLINWLPALVMYRPKIRFEGEKQRLATMRGGCVIAANHRGFLDFPLFICLFLFRNVRTVVGESLYDSSKSMTWILRKFGCIRTDRFSADPQWLYESVQWLQNGGVLLIFPEGHFEEGDTVDAFKESVALLAVQGGVPVLPVYHEGFGGWHRTRVTVGQPIHLSDMCADLDPSSAQLTEMAAVVRDKVCALQALSRAQDAARKPLWHRIGNALHPRYWMYYFVKSTGAAAAWLLMWPRCLYVGCSRQVRRHKGPALVICNHRWWPDAAVIAFFFFWRRLYSVIAAEIMGDGFSGWIMGNMLCIPVKRGELDLACYKACIEQLSRGKMVIILPEGKLNTSDVPLLPFKSGAALIALNARVPIIPMATDGVFLPFRRLNVAFGAPIDPVKATEDCGGISQKVTCLTALMEQEVGSLYATLYSRMTPRQKARVTRYQQKNMRYLADKNHMTAEEYEARITERK